MSTTVNSRIMSDHTHENPQPMMVENLEKIKLERFESFQKLAMEVRDIRQELDSVRESIQPGKPDPAGKIDFKKSWDRKSRGWRD